MNTHYDDVQLESQTVKESEMTSMLNRQDHLIESLLKITSYLGSKLEPISISTPTKDENQKNGVTPQPAMSHIIQRINVNNQTLSHIQELIEKIISELQI